MRATPPRPERPDASPDRADGAHERPPLPAPELAPPAPQAAATFASADLPEAALAPGISHPFNGGPPVAAGCTAPQLRRFIKSRPYVPMHELRRRFGINGHEDDVSAIDLGDRRVFVGLPPREGSLVGELLRGGDIGYELSLDPITPIVVGVYPMRPVTRG